MYCRMQIVDCRICNNNFYNKNSVIVKEKNILGNRQQAQRHRVIADCRMQIAEWIEKKHKGTH